MASRVRAGIIGTGFMGDVHAYAVRAAGGVVSRVAGSTPGKAASGAERMHAERAAASVEELVTAGDVDVVHVCTPNALHAAQAELAIRAGKHVICEKPLATRIEDARRLVELGTEAGVVTAVPFVYRFYPAVRDARTRIAQDAGPLWLLHGSYLQDWLASRDVTNWRVDPALGGASRAFGDIGVHWCDLMEFTTGHRIVRLTAQMITAHRHSGDAIESAGTEDAAAVLFDTDRGASGAVLVSQVSAGRKNKLWFSFDGASAAYVFNQELPDSLWIGGQAENRVVPTGPDTVSGPAQPYRRLPAGHPQGYQDCFNAFVADVHAAIGGQKVDGLPTFADGLRAAAITAAVVESATSQSWVEVLG